MARKLLIVLVNTDPRNPEELGAPFYHAAVAAAMDYEVDVICAATAGRLMRKGVAEAIRIKAGQDKTAYDWVREAHGHGAHFWACPGQPRALRHDGDGPDPRVQWPDGCRDHVRARHVRRLSRAHLLIGAADGAGGRQGVS
jgi:predicted peroxiredoxin